MPLRHAKPADTNILPVSSTVPSTATSAETVISHHTVSTAGDLLLPSPGATMVTAGTCEILTITPSTTTIGSPTANGDGPVASTGFTRVAISFDDDDDDDEEEEETKQQPAAAISSHQQPPSPEKTQVCDEQKEKHTPTESMTATTTKVTESELPPSSFTRMQIVVEDDSSDEEKSASSAAAVTEDLPGIASSSPIPSPSVTIPSPCGLAPSADADATGSPKPSMAALLRTLVELDGKLKESPQV